MLALNTCINCTVFANPLKLHRCSYTLCESPATLITMSLYASSKSKAIAPDDLEMWNSGFSLNIHRNFQLNSRVQYQFNHRFMQNKSNSMAYYYVEIKKNTPIYISESMCSMFVFIVYFPLNLKSSFRVAFWFLFLVKKLFKKNNNINWCFKQISWHQHSKV